jgi:hypothetical protein
MLAVVWFLTIFSLRNVASGQKMKVMIIYITIVHILVNECSKQAVEFSRLIFAQNYLGYELILVLS